MLGVVYFAIDLVEGVNRVKIWGGTGRRHAGDKCSTWSNFFRSPYIHSLNASDCRNDESGTCSDGSSTNGYANECHDRARCGCGTRDSRRYNPLFHDVFGWLTLIGASTEFGSLVGEIGPTGQATMDNHITTFSDRGAIIPIPTIRSLSTPALVTYAVASLQTSGPPGHSFPRVVEAVLIVAFIVIISLLLGWYLIRRRNRSLQAGHTSLSSVPGDIEKPRLDLSEQWKHDIQPTPFQEILDPFADPDPNLRHSPPLAENLPTSGTKTEPVTRKPIPAPLNVLPIIPSVDIESLSVATPQSDKGSIGTPRRRKHGSLSLFPNKPRTPRPGTPSSIDDKALATGAGTLRNAFPSPRIHDESSGYSSDSECRRRPGGWGQKKSCMSANNSPLHTPSSSFETLVDPFADPVAGLQADPRQLFNSKTSNENHSTEAEDTMRSNRRVKHGSVFREEF